MAFVEAQTHRRFLKSHLPVDALVFSPNVKYLYIARDGRDVLWSLYNHHRTFKKDVLRSIDGVSWRVGPPLGDAPESVLQYFHDWLAYGGTPWWPFWEYLRSWWAIEDLSNVMLLHFARLKADMSSEIRRIAAFLEIPIDKSNGDVILEHFSFEYMKAHGATMVPFSGELWEGGVEAFMHKGANEKWKDMLTTEDIEHYEHTVKQNVPIGWQQGRFRAQQTRPDT